MLFLSEDISISGLQVPFLLFFPVIIVYLRPVYILWIGRPENIGVAVGISKTPCSYQKLFLFPVYKRHFVFNGDHYLSVSDIRPLDWAPPKM